VQLPVLNFPLYSFRITTNEGGQSSKIFDTVRRRFVWLTPEEWVRQHLLHYLVTEKKVPKSLVAVEKNLKVNGLPRRTDVLVYSKTMKKVLLAECKAPSVKITQKVFDQAARYNMTLDVIYFVVTNGMETICCTMDHEKQKYNFLREIPLYGEMT
jgi:hypothetical protein